MKGGINKIIRNITATQAKGDFEKVLILIENSSDSSRRLITWTARSQKRSMLFVSESLWRRLFKILCSHH